MLALAVFIVVVFEILPCLTTQELEHCAWKGSQVQSG